VTARSWADNVRGAVGVLDRYRELERVHIVADARGADAAALEAELAALARAGQTSPWPGSTISAGSYWRAVLGATGLARLGLA